LPTVPYLPIRGAAASTLHFTAIPNDVIGDPAV
jgi:hypothetical protein